MIALKPRDAAILARVAQYEELPEREREDMLRSVSSTAKKIGYILIRNSKKGSPEEVKTAKVLKAWARSNRGFARARRVRSSKATAR